MCSNKSNKSNKGCLCICFFWRQHWIGVVCFFLLALHECCQATFYFLSKNIKWEGLLSSVPISLGGKCFLKGQFFFFFTTMLQHILQFSRICKKNTNGCNQHGKWLKDHVKFSLECISLFYVSLIIGLSSPFILRCSQKQHANALSFSCYFFFLS